MNVRARELASHRGNVGPHRQVQHARRDRDYGEALSQPRHGVLDGAGQLELGHGEIGKVPDAGRLQAEMGIVGEERRSGLRPAGKGLTMRARITDKANLLTLVDLLREEYEVIAPFYGMNPRPLEAVARSCPVVGSYPDPDFTTGAGRALDAALDTYHIPHDIKIYKGARHSFFNDQNSSTYNPQASADAWQRTLAFFSERLG